MSYSIGIEVWCDGCGSWLRAEGVTRREADAEVKGLGWATGRRDGRKVHTCPKCQKKEAPSGNP